jgi:hypothetical protein
MKTKTNKISKQSSPHKQRTSPLPKKLHKKGIIVWHKFVKVSSSLVLIICWNDITEKSMLRKKIAMMVFNQFIEIKISREIEIDMFSRC